MMLIILDINTPKSDIDRIFQKIQSYKCFPEIITNDNKLTIRVTGSTNELREDEFYLMDSVTEVIRITNKYKLVSRQMKNEKTIINISGNQIGSDELLIIAGPCAVENREMMMQTAQFLVDNGIRFMRAGAYKPRTSPYNFQGLKEKAIDILIEVKDKYKLKIVTEAINHDSLQNIEEVADIIQIGARNMQNFSLLESAGKTGKPILLKRGLSATIEELLLSAEYIVSQNNFNVILCERGIRTFETSTRNTLDLNAIPVIKSKTHLPIIVDPSHGIGIADKVNNMSLAGIAAGADGLIIEIHPDPRNAMSDGIQSLTFTQFEKLLTKLRLLAPVVDRRLN